MKFVRILYLMTTMLVFSYFLVVFNSENIEKDETDMAKLQIEETSGSKVETGINAVLPAATPRVVNRQSGSSGIKQDSKPVVVVAREEDDNIGTLYKWKSASKVTVISMDPPPDGTTASIFHYSTRPGSQASSVIDSNADSGSIDEDNTVTSFREEPLKVYTPEGLKEFVEYSKEIGEKIELRGEELNELIKLL